MPQLTEAQKADWEKQKKALQSKRPKEEGDLRVILDRTQEMKDLEDENKKLKSELDMVSVRAFDKEVEKYTKEAEALGFEVGYIDDPKALEHLKTQITEKRAKKDPAGSVPLSTRQTSGYREEDFESDPEVPETPKQTLLKTKRRLLKRKQMVQRAYDIPIDMLEFDSKEEMMKVLDDIAQDSAHPRSKEAKAFTSKIWSKHVLKRREPFNLSFKRDPKTKRFKIDVDENE